MDNFKEEFYKRVYKYALEIVKFVNILPKNAATKVLGNQLLRSGTSISANIIEAKAASSKKDYINFYLHALKSANETKLWLSLLRDSESSITKSATDLLKETCEIANILGRSVITMKNNK